MRFYRKAQDGGKRKQRQIGIQKLQGKSVKKKNRLKEKDITGSVKRANHQQGSMTVSDPTVLVQSGGNSLSSRFVRLCVAACFIHGAS